MQLTTTAIDGLVELQPDVFKDDRGYFFEEFHERSLEKLGLNFKCVQANQSFSKKNVIRGLHLQVAPHEQAKYVRVISGEVLDIVVDLRPGSPTYGKHHKCILSDQNGKILIVPRGFAHGFSALTDTVFHYMCDNFYNREHEKGIRWDDPELGIDWEIKDPIISEKDRILPTFKDFREGK